MKTVLALAEAAPSTSGVNAKLDLAESVLTLSRRRVASSKQAAPLEEIAAALKDFDFVGGGIYAQYDDKNGIAFRCEGMEFPNPSGEMGIALHNARSDDRMEFGLRFQGQRLLVSSSCNERTQRWELDKRDSKDVLKLVAQAWDRGSRFRAIQGLFRRNHAHL